MTTPETLHLHTTWVAFFPTRNAVMVEGPSDMLLLPTMMREALKADILGFQFVPGLSYTEGPLHAPAVGKTSGLLYLVDGDVGGAKIRSRLTASGVPPENVIILSTKDGSAVEVEDFIEPELLIEGANGIMDRYYVGADHIALDEITTSSRMHSLETKFKLATKRKL